MFRISNKWIEVEVKRKGTVEVWFVLSYHIFNSFSYQLFLGTFYLRLVLFIYLFFFFNKNAYTFR